MLKQTNYCFGENLSVLMHHSIITCCYLNLSLKDTAAFHVSSNCDFRSLAQSPKHGPINTEFIWIKSFNRKHADSLYLTLSVVWQPLWDAVIRFWMNLILYIHLTLFHNTPTAGWLFSLVLNNLSVCFLQLSSFNYWKLLHSVYFHFTPTTFYVC